MFYRVHVRWRADGRAAQEVVVTLEAASGDAAAAGAHARVQAERGGSTIVAGVMPVTAGEAVVVVATPCPTPRRRKAAKPPKTRKQEKTR
jgi:hypothetical protein